MNQPEDASQLTHDGHGQRSSRDVIPSGDYSRGFPQTLYRNERVGQRVRDNEELESMADNPLFRGLLQELPPRAQAPNQEWLDRWTATARSILDLLYSRDVNL